MKAGAKKHGFDSRLCHLLEARSGLGYLISCFPSLTRRVVLRCQRSNGCKRAFCLLTRRRRTREHRDAPPSQPAGGGRSPEPAPPPPRPSRPRRRFAPGAANGIYANDEDAGDRPSAPAPRRPRAPPLQGRAACPEVATEELSPWVPGRWEEAWRGEGRPAPLAAVRLITPGCASSSFLPVSVSCRPVPSLISISRGLTPYLHSRIVLPVN